MVNPGSFQGARKQFLLSQKAEYALAIKDRHSAETLSLIQRRFFKRFPIDLPDDSEPSEEQLALVNNDAPDPELTDIGELTESESDNGTGSTPSNTKAKKKSKKAKKNSKSRKNRIAFRREQIKRWMAYQYTKDNSTNERENGVFNPYKVLLPKFVSGIKNSDPRRKPALNIWRRTQRAEINNILQTQVQKAQQEGNSIPPSHFATRRESIARTLFGQLPDEEKQRWETLANEEHQLALAQKELEQEQEVSTSPADRQRHVFFHFGCMHFLMPIFSFSAIQRLPGFVKPILDLICDVTGWKATLIAGGPEPALHGQFSVISVHSGVTSGPVPMNFGCAQRACYKKEIIPAFGKFLQLCYEPDECRSRALAPDQGFLPMASVLDADTDENLSAFIHTIDQNPLAPQPIPTVHTSTTPTTSPEQNMEREDDQNPNQTTDDEEGQNPFPISVHSPPASNNSLPPSPVALPLRPSIDIGFYQTQDIDPQAPEADRVGPLFNPLQATITIPSHPSIATSLPPVAVNNVNSNASNARPPALATHSHHNVAPTVSPRIDPVLVANAPSNGHAPPPPLACPPKKAIPRLPRLKIVLPPSVCLAPAESLDIEEAGPASGRTSTKRRCRKSMKGLENPDVGEAAGPSSKKQRRTKSVIGPKAGEKALAAPEGSSVRDEIPEASGLTNKRRRIKSAKALAMEES